MHVIRTALIAIMSLWAFGVTAAPVQNIDLTLRFDGHSYLDFEIYDISGDDETLLFGTDRLDEADDVLGLPRIFPAFTIGQNLNFSASLIPTSAEDRGSATSCVLGIYTCTGPSFVGVSDTAFSLLYGDMDGDYEWLRGSLLAGGMILFDYLLPAEFRKVRLTNEFEARWSLEQARFTVLDQSPDLAPIPLPTPAALLPLGFTGFALIRRKRRKAQQHRIA